MPRRMSSVTLSVWVSAYASASVDPQEPPKTIHFSMSRCSRRRSMSATRCHVVFVSRAGGEGASLTCGGRRPHPR